MTKDLEVVSAVCRVRRMGCSREKQRAGAATLEIHMEANMATNMLASSTLAGFWPTCNKSLVVLFSWNAQGRGGRGNTAWLHAVLDDEVFQCW